MSTMRIATAAIVTRGQGRDAEVLLVRRSPKLRFFGGYWAFPGGVVDDADHDGDPDADLSHVRCALRELYEEVGLEPTGLQEPPAADLRAGLLERDAAQACHRFRALLDGASAALDSVRCLARLTTPPFAPVRYRTRFIHLEAPAGFVPEVIDGELVEGAFVRPGPLLERWRRGELLIAPPVVYMLEHLDALGLDEFLGRIPEEAASLEAGRLHPIRNVPGVIMAPLATRTLPPATTTNAYLVGEERLYVVDPAPTDPVEQERLFRLIDERIEGGASLVGALLTHHHPDHVGAVEQTARRYDVPVLAHRATLERLELEVENTRPLEDGVELPLGSAPDGSDGWVLTAIHTPGHAPGHLCFRESRYGAVLAGDLVSTVSTIMIDPPEGHMATYVASLERMGEIMAQGGVLHPAHGPVASDGPRVLARFLEHRARREEGLVAALGAGLSTESELVRRVYADVPEGMHPIAARSLAASLEKLAEEGRARRHGDGGWKPLD